MKEGWMDERREGIMKDARKDGWLGGRNECYSGRKEGRKEGMICYQGRKEGETDMPEGRKEGMKDMQEGRKEGMKDMQEGRKDMQEGRI